MALAWALNEPAWVGEEGLRGDGAGALRRQWSRVASCARAAGPSAEALARFASVAETGLHDDSSVSLREALAQGLAAQGPLRLVARVVHLAIARAVLPAVLRAVRSGRPRLAERLLVDGLGLDCPRAMSGAMRLGDPAERAARLAEARCLPICPQAVDALAFAGPSAAAMLHPATCSPASMGLRTDFDRDTAFLNPRAWGVLRALEVLQESVEALEEAKADVARLAVAGGLSGGVRAALEGLRLPVSPPPGVPSEGGRLLRWPRARRTAPLDGGALPSLYAIGDGDRLWLGGAPRARGWTEAGRLEGTPWPGHPVEGAGREALGAARSEAAPGSEGVWLLLEAGCARDEACSRAARRRLRALGLERVVRGMWDPWRGEVVPQPQGAARSP